MAQGQLVAVVVVVFHEGQVLALRRAATNDAGAGAWECVSGRVELGEDPFVAAKREAREETGLDVVVDERPIDAYAALRGAAPMTIIVYRARSTSTLVRRSGEHDAHEWLSVDEFARRTPFVRLAAAVARAADAAREASPAC